MRKPIYLDYNATTPTDPRVVQAMLPYFHEEFGNPANTLHSYGLTAESAIKKACTQVAELIKCKPNEITWNAGATEGNNTVVFGLIRKLKLENPQQPIHFITSCIEHWSILNSFKAAEKFEQIEVSFLPVNNKGFVQLNDLKKAVRPHTKLVSVMWVNNEIGSINPICEIADFCKQNQIFFHTDATQAIGKIEIDFAKSKIDFLTFSAHKFYGPKGVGALVTSTALEPYIVGGGHQRNQRSGTLNVPSIVGAGIAAELCSQVLKEENKKTKYLSELLYKKLLDKIPNLKLNGPDFIEDGRSPINLSLQFPKPIDFVLSSLTDLAFSQGSACHTGEATSSHVLTSIGLSSQQASHTMRLSVGRWTTEDEVHQAVDVIYNAFKD